MPDSVIRPRTARASRRIDWPAGLSLLGVAIWHALAVAAVVVEFRGLSDPVWTPVEQILPSAGGSRLDDGSFWPFSHGSRSGFSGH